jgi:DNA-binding response OmpR family regulator
VCAAIRRQFAETLQIIMLSARDGKEDLVEAFAAGANDYLAKPVVKELLLARVAVNLRARSQNEHDVREATLP